VAVHGNKPWRPLARSSIDWAIMVIVSPRSTSYSASALTHHEPCRSLQCHGPPRNSLPDFNVLARPVIRPAPVLQHECQVAG